MIKGDNMSFILGMLVGFCLISVMCILYLNTLPFGRLNTKSANIIFIITYISFFGAIISMFVSIMVYVL